MPVKINEFSPFLALQDVERVLGKITPASGYNTRPTLVNKPITSTNVKGNSFPALYLELIGYEGQGQLQGGYSSFTENGVLHLLVWGYIRETGDQKKAMMELFVDVLEGLWVDGSRGGNAVMTHVDLVQFESSFLNSENVGAVVIPISVQTQIDRGAG